MPGTRWEVRLTGRGDGVVSAELFEVAEVQTPALMAGEVLVRVDAISLDPYQRIRLRGLGEGDVPPAGCVGQVVESRSPDLAEGTWVTGELGWRDHAIAVPAVLTVIEVDPRIPVHHHVGLLGLSGLTAYFGVTRVLRPRPGQSIVVSGAYGGVGQVALQIADLLGADTLGIVSSEEKVRALARLGLASLSRLDPSWVEQLSSWAPDGVHGFFDNVWGDTASRVVEQLRPLGHIALCGQMTGLADGRVPPLDIDWYLILTRSLTLQGFRTVDYLQDYADGRRQLAQWFVEGSLRQEVNLVSGLKGAGEAFTQITSGTAVGKTIITLT